MGRNLVIGLVALVAGAVGWHFLAPRPEPITYTRIVVDTIYGEPDTVRTVVDRIIYIDREPEVVITQPGGGEDVVEDFCRPDTVVRIIEGDTVWAPADTVYLVRSVTHDPGRWFWEKDRVSLFGPTSVGDLSEVRFTAWPGWNARTAPELLIRDPRFGWFWPLAEALVYGGIGYGLATIIH